MDNLSRDQRRRAMRAVEQKDTKPEIYVRRRCHSAGLRFRLHRKELPGCPDLVFPKRNVCLFVNGCFWHQHEGCRKAKRPTTRAEFWQEKLDKNVTRDEKNYARLCSLGWKVVIIWECELSNQVVMQEKIEAIRNSQLLGRKRVKT